ncbi:Spon1, partial [Symbiodinium necroappetens]
MSAELYDIFAKRAGPLAIDLAPWSLAMNPEDSQRAAALEEVRQVWGGASVPLASNSMTSVMDTAPEGRRGAAEALDDRQPKWPKPAMKGRPGKGNTGSWWTKDWGKEWEKDQAAQSSGLDRPTTVLLQALTKMALRHEEELSRTRADTNFMLFVDVDGEHSVLPTLQMTAANWQEAFSAGRVTTSLRIVLFLGMMQQLQTKLQELLQNQEQLDRLMAVGWLQQGATALTPVWNYYRWDAATQTQVVSDQQPLSHDSVLQCVDVLLKTACNPLVLLRFRAAKELEDPTGDVIPFLVSVSLRGQQAQDCFTALQTLSHNGVLKLLSLRLRPERLRKGPMAEAVEEAYLATPWTAFQWIGALLGARELCYGAAEAAMRLAVSTALAHAHLHANADHPQLHLCLESGASMAVQLELPSHMYFAALEESLLLEALRTLHGGFNAAPLPSDLTMAARNDIAAFAQRVLAPPAFAAFLHYAEQLSVSIKGETRCSFPPLPRAAGGAGTEAEACAEAFLLEGSGVLWSAARMVVNQLNCYVDKRPHGNGHTFSLGAFNKGGLLGIHKHTTHHQAVCTLLNALVRSMAAGHVWTTLVVNYDNHTAPHYDRGNSEHNPSLLVGISHHDSGELWIERPGGRDYQLVDGDLLAGDLHPTSACGLLFNGSKQCHATCQWTGRRMTIIAYAIRCHELLLSGTRAYLE